MSGATVGAALRAGAKALVAAGIEGGARDVRLLMASVLGLEPGRMTLHLNDDLPAAAAASFEAFVQRRAAREPVSHLIGRRAFFGRDFAVSADVLDPRPETEALVLAALERPFERVLDLGTGSGCILLTLLAERGSARGLGADLSAAALAMAQRNAAALGVAERCGFVCSDWFGAIEGRYDLIVSNPPYIAQAEMGTLAPELSHEPALALTDGADGLAAYRIICARAPAYLAKGGALIVEIGPTQGAEVSAMMRAAGLRDVHIRPDLDGRARVVLGCQPA
ncbi:peptide chain release factor N(5)-glutamine methyltransferase [uncultured Lentibacter sp.]|uniref:peptide chain release factor N(5)-glutamine methyltransferase n=1 Tax=uncultured Lentibacter sp. TaxID=1659309 RepID=UPI00262E3461|nr:peptide chain release factor N(5)-glutamine methyltransferase [uncultured Lentibacter sp.]